MLQFAILKCLPTICAVAASLLLSDVAAGVDPSLLPTQHLRRTWSVSDGIPDESVGALARGADGVLWVGTTGGLSQFNGTSFESYTRANTPAMLDDDIWALACGRDGSVWIGTREGLVRRSPTGEFTRQLLASGMPSPHVTSIAEDAHGAVWVGTLGGGLARIAGDVVSSWGVADGLSNVNVWGVYPERDGSVWVATVDGLFVWRDGRFDRFGKEAGLPSTFVTSVKTAPDGTLWLGTMAGLCQMNDGKVVRTIGAADGMKDPRTLRIVLDRQGTLWAATMKGGVVKVAASGVRSLDMSNGLGSTSSRCVFEDSEGYLWIGHSGGLMQLSDGFVTPWTSFEGVGQGPRVLAIGGDGGVLVGCDDGLFAKRGDRFARVLADRVDGRIEGVAVSRDNAVWTGGLNAVRRTLGDESTEVELPRPVNRTDRPNTIGCIVADPDGSVWVGAGSGLYRFEPGQTTVARVWTDADGLPNNHVLCVAPTPKDGLWIGTRSGLARMVGGTITTYGLKDGLPNLQVQALRVDSEGTLWIGTERGLVSRRGDSFSVWGVAQGLPNDQIRSIADGADGWLWLCSAKGLMRVSKASLLRPEGGATDRLELQFFGQHDGLQGRGTGGGFHSPGCVSAPDGSIWLITNDCIGQVRPGATVSERPGPPVVIAGVRVDGEPRTVADVIQVDAHTRRVNVQLRAIDFGNAGAVEYRYRLDGDDAVDGIWSATGPGGLITFGSVPSGRTTVRAQARRGGGTWSSVDAVVTIDKAARFYERWWFYGVSTILVGGGAYWLHRGGLARQRQRLKEVQQAVEDERSRLASDIHDSLAQSFAGIAMQLEAAEDAALSGDRLASAVGIGKARQIARFGLSEARRSVMTLRTEQTLAGGLAQALRMLADRTTVRGLLTCEVVRSPASVDISSELALSILQTAQEAIGNAIRHGKPTLIKIDLVDQGGVLTLRVEDNGTGLAAGHNTLREGTGIAMMRRRAERFAGTFSVEQVPSGGVVVQAVFHPPRGTVR